MRASLQNAGFRRAARAAVTPARAPSAVHLTRTLGNRGLARLVQTKLAVAAPGDRWEREADRVADEVMRGPVAAAPHQGAGVGVQRCAACAAGGAPCTHCAGEVEDEETPVRRQAAGGGVPSLSTAADSRVRAATAGGEPLSAGLRGFFEPRFGQGLGGVRVHTGAAAARAARELDARAFTVGRDVVFGDGQYAPETAPGRRLLAHELAHTLQQDAPGAPPQTIHRQPNEPSEPATPSLPPVSIPGTGLTLIPGLLRPTSLLGTRLPLPASLRLTNAIGVGSAPGFVLDLSPRLLVLSLLDNIDLSVSTRPGTPEGAEARPENQQRVSLLRPRLTFDPASGRLRGTAVLSVGSEYPPSMHGPTDLDVEIESTELGQFTGRLGYGPLSADFSLRLHYDTGRLERALSPVFAPQGGFAGFWARFQAIMRDVAPGVPLEGRLADVRALFDALVAGQVQVGPFVTRTLALLGSSIPAGADLARLRAALGQLATEATHPGFSLSGGLRLGPVPLTAFRAEAPTTVPLARPLLGAPTSFPLSYTAGGVVIAPPGAITSTAVPALGVSHSSFGERTGTSLTTALLPTLSTTAIGEGRPLVEQFPVYAYAELSHVRRITQDFDLGVRITAQVSTPELFGAPAAAPTDPAARLQQQILQYREAAGGTGTAPPANLGLTVFGRFSAF